MTSTNRTTCTFRDCERPALKGWTTCAKHYTAGKSRKQVKR